MKNNPERSWQADEAAWQKDNVIFKFIFWRIIMTILL